MPSSVRPKGSGSGSRAPPVTPMSERQQMALLMQMTSGNNDVGSRSPSSSNARSRERNERGETPLHLASIKGDVEQVCKLLAHRADPNAADFAGWTPLHEACNHGRYEVALRLVQSGASLNARGLDDDTPLHDAAANGHLKLARMLAERGADIRAKNAKGRTPIDVAPASMKPYLLDLSLPLPESTGARLQPRSRDDKKLAATSSSSTSSGGESSTSTKQKDDVMDVKTSSAEDVYEFKATKENSSVEQSCDSKESSQMDLDATDPLGGVTDVSQSEDGPTASVSSKRTFSDIADAADEPATPAPAGTAQANTDEESRRKKRKDDTVKEGKLNVQRSIGQSKGQTGKQSVGSQSKSGLSGSIKGGADKKSPCSSPKPTVSDPEVDEGKSDLKVPPLKIVIPQTNSSEQEAVGRNGKNSSQRTHPALPYVVASSTTGGSGGSGSDSSEKESTTAMTTATPVDSVAGNTAVATGKTDEKKEAGSGVSDERGGSSHQRVLRSSRGTGTDRGSNNCSPQLQRSRSPSLSEEASPPNNSNNNHRQADPPGSGAAHANATSKSADIQAQPHNSETETSTGTASCATPSVSATTTASGSAPPVELHPRKRKLKQNKEQAASQQEPTENTAEAQVHPHEQPITNCYRLFLNIRKQIGKRRRGLFPVQPKPPQGFKDYLMNRCTYVLAGTAPTSPNINYPQNLAAQMKDLFTDQEKERYRLRTQHVIEKEKLVLSVEQEILRVHGRAARALANQSLPFSVCTILRDEEVYNLITPEQEEKDRNARSRYNGRLFLSWLQDVDDKWEKIKEHMLLRHHNEAESLHAVQKMDWEWKMKELSLCDRKSTPKIEDTHVPMVHVSDDFDLLPA